EERTTPGRTIAITNGENNELSERRSTDTAPEGVCREVAPVSHHHYDQKPRSATLNSITGALTSVTSAFGMTGKDSKSASRSSSPGPPGKEDAPLLLHSAPIAESGSPDRKPRHHSRQASLTLPTETFSQPSPKSSDVLYLNNRIDSLAK
ncbi:hypothetical protein Anas_02081, partial [Armadillidium nasatum]